MLTLSAEIAGENAIILYLPEPLQDSYPKILQYLGQRMKKAGAIDVVPAYRSLLVIYQSSTHDAKLFSALALETLPAAIEHAEVSANTSDIIRIPVCYDPLFAQDLSLVADYAGCSTDEVIQRHCQPTYTVCCLGFIPGFAFLGYVDDTIAAPRHPEPRSKVMAGSVGIAGQQTGVYPADSPGGWNIIGRTPMTLYAPNQDLMSCFKLGDCVQFYPIDVPTFKTWTANKH